MTDSPDTRWRLTVLDPSAPVDVDAISATVESVFTTLFLHGSASLDLTTIEGPVNGEHLAAVLRASALARESIPGWSAARGVAHAALVAEGKDPADALFGL
jgi:hypothetical protein